MSSDTSDEVWDALKKGGEEPWLVNEAFLCRQLEAVVERIDFAGAIIFNPDGTVVHDPFAAPKGDQP